jgi:hypothetical protein
LGDDDRHRIVMCGGESIPKLVPHAVAAATSNYFKNFPQYTITGALHAVILSLMIG